MKIENPFSIDGKQLNKLVVSRDKEHVTTEIDGEVVLLDLTSNSYLGFDAVASSIWGALEQPITLQDLLKLLAEKYDVTEDVCRADTLSFLQDLYERNLLDVEGGKS